MDAAYLSQSELCLSEKLPSDLIKIYEPFKLGDDSAGILSGTIYRYDITPTPSLFISGTNSSLQSDLQKSILPSKKKPMGQIEQEYEDGIDKLKVSGLCGNKNSDSAIVSLNNSITEKKYTDIFVLSKEFKDSIWNGILVFKDVVSLRSKIVSICEKHSQKNILIIIDPISLPTENPQLITDTINTPKIEETISSSKDYEAVKTILKNISNQATSFEERMNAVNDAMQTMFSKDFEVESYLNNKGVASHYWAKGHGRKYLENLATDRSILDFKIEVVTRNKDDNKVNFLQVTEIHN
jgi:hypothetical protein